MEEYLPYSGIKCLVFRLMTRKIANRGLLQQLRIYHCHCRLSPPPPSFKDLFSTPREDIVPDLLSVSFTDNSETLPTVVANTSTGGPGGWFGICSYVLNAPMAYTVIVMFTSSSWEGSVLLPSILDEFMVRALKLPKCVLQSVVSFAVLTPV